jgi:penicillin-binding protein 1C
MLQDVRRPGAEAYWASFREKYPIAWKTGTSYGQRDAWAVGVSPEWTIVVWTGNFTGEENANLRSTTSAGILLFDLFNALPKDPARAWFEPERHSLRSDEVCLATGYRATPACPETRYVEMPAHASPLAPCPYHRRIFVTLDERYQVDAGSWEPGNYKRVSRLFYPVEVVQYLRENGTIIERVPPYAPGYASTASNDLAVVYPDNGARLFLPRDLNGKLQRVTLQAAHRRANTRLFWYLNGTYLGETARRHVMVPPLEAGEHELVIVDEHGLRAKTSFTVSQSRR